MAKLIVITGARGCGKTQLAATHAPPSQINRVFYHDSERSANNVLEQLGERDLSFGHYVDLSTRFAIKEDLMARINEASRGKTNDLPWVTVAERNALIDYYLFTLDDLDKHLIKGAFNVYVHDTLEKLEAGMAAWVESHKRQSGVTQTAYGKLWTEGVYPLYEQFIAAVEARGVGAIILTSHLRTPWENNKPVLGKIEPSAKKLLYRLSSLMLWLVHDPANEDGAPAALVLKERMGNFVPSVSGDTWEQRRTLPYRLPHATWNDIAYYQTHPANLAHPGPREVMSQAEAEMISELLTDKQMELMILGERKEVIEMQQSAGPVLTSPVTPTWQVGVDPAAPGGDQSVAAPLGAAPTSPPAPVVTPPSVDQSEQITTLWREGIAAGQIATQLHIPLPVVLRVQKQLTEAGEVQPL